MSQQSTEPKYTVLVSDSFEKTDENCNYEILFRRWLVREIEEQKMTVSEAIKIFNFNPASARILIRSWIQKYGAQMALTLPEMSAEKKQNLADLQHQNKLLAKQLEDAKMKNIALEMLIDVAEEKLKITIRKKPGAKQ